MQWMCIHMLPVGQFLWGHLWSTVQKAAEIQSKPLPSPQVTWCWADSRVGIPYGFSLYTVKINWPHVAAHTLHNLRCCFMRRVPVGPHTPCTAQRGAGTWGAGQLLASPGRGLGHSSRCPLGTYAPWFWHVRSLAESSNCALSELRGLAGEQRGTCKWEQPEGSEPPRA